MEPKAPGMKYLPLLVFQLVLAALFFVFVKYDGDNHHQLRGFEDTHVMIYIGFGFLMTFLKKYCYSALGFNWLLAALVAQWSLLTQGWFNMKDMVIPLSKETIIEADIMAATILITFGALLGVASGGQLLFIAIVETAIASANIYLITSVFQAADVGGSIAIHSFGAYFGLGVSLALKSKKVEGQAEKNVLNAPTYISDVTAMIGSIFLYIYWPSFNSALTGTDEEYQRAVTNTYLSLASCTVVTFILSSILNHEPGKFDMVHIQNSTLAGGVAVGSVCNMHVQAGGAILIGIGAATISVLGYRFLTPKLEKLGLLDTCGVHNLHGMPGVYSGLLSVLFAALATSSTYGETGLHSVFGAMKDGRKAKEQALYQLAAVGATLAISFVSGMITGFVAKLKIFAPLDEKDKYNDELNWELP
ncbi:ammonium transporter Rh type B-B-like [Cydia amplana]|uniref:ammonium transporter Rh type B-B-like n=1 Tax=Cydia amplana TaxID=1869771 RepID=UPI002FE5AF99